MKRIERNKRNRAEKVINNRKIQPESAFDTAGGKTRGEVGYQEAGNEDRFGLESTHGGEIRGGKSGLVDQIREREISEGECRLSYGGRKRGKEWEKW